MSKATLLKGVTVALSFLFAGAVTVVHASPEHGHIIVSYSENVAMDRLDAVVENNTTAAVVTLPFSMGTPSNDA